MENQELADLRARETRVCRQIAVGLLHTLAHQLGHGVLPGQIGVTAVGKVAALGPIPHRGEVDIDENGAVVAALAKGHRLLDVREELQLVLQILRSEERSLVQAADILGAVDDLQMAVLVEKPRVARVDPAVRGLRGRRRVGILEVGVEDAGTAEHHLPVVLDPDLDIPGRRSDSVRLDLSVGLHADEHGAFRRAIELFDVDSQAAVEVEEVGSDRLAGRVGQPDPRKAENVLQGLVEQVPAERVEKTILPGNGLAVEDSSPGAPGDPHEEVEHPALDRGGILHADQDLREHVLVNARRGEVVGRPDLLEVVGDRVARLRTADAEARYARLGVREEVVADPGHRQIGEHLVSLVQALALDPVAPRRHEVVVGEHDALGAPGRPRGVEDDRDVASGAARHLLLEEPRMLAIVVAAEPLDLCVILEGRAVIVAQPSGIVVDDPVEQGTFLSNLQ